MKLFNKYNIPADAGVVDVELNTDNKVWIDPMMMYIDKSNIGKDCCLIVKQYFQDLLDYAIDDDYENGYLYTKEFAEINETRLGYSSNRPRGVSGGENLGKQIFDLIRNSNAVKNGMIGDIFDAEVMIDKLGIDKLSDFITNLILERLIKFTQDQCQKYNIPMQNITLNCSYWSYTNQKWKKRQTVQLPFDEESNMAIVFVPINFCEKKAVYSYNKVYKEVMIPYICKIAVHNRIEGLIRILKDGRIKPYKKNIKKEYPCTRNNVSKFITDHNDVYKNYKNRQLKYSNYSNYK